VLHTRHSKLAPIAGSLVNDHNRTKATYKYGLPEILHDSFVRYLIINDHTPFGKIANVKILGSNGGIYAIDNERFGLHSDRFFVILGLSFLVANETYTLVSLHFLAKCGIFGFGVVLTDRLDVFGSDIDTRPTIFIASLRHGQIPWDKS
jgi:hypothetical protein